MAIKNVCVLGAGLMGSHPLPQPPHHLKPQNTPPGFSNCLSRFPFKF